jgi:hypothetical protein
LSVTDSSFTNNYASDGGALHLDGDFVVADTNFTSNVASQSGGAMYYSDGFANISSVVLNSNAAPSGGAVYLVKGYLGVHDSIISNNSAVSQGGCVVAAIGTAMVMFDTLCSDNTCHGNGGCCHTGGSFECDNCTLSGNQAVFSGAGIYTDFGATTTFNNSLLKNNTAKQSGGAWFGIGAEQQLVHNEATKFVDNTAGCCYASGYGSTLQSNAASASMTCSDTDTGSEHLTRSLLSCYGLHLILVVC